MKKLSIIVNLVLSGLWLQAQIVVTNATFPVAGDTLKTASDFTPTGITVTAAGGPYVWNYTSLNAEFTQETVFQAASTGTSFAAFPGAELVSILPGGNETYYDVSATAFSNMGYSGDDPTGLLPFQTDFRYSTPIPLAHAPLTFPSNFVSSANLAVAIAIADLPAGVLDSLGVPTGFLDSIRVRIITSRNDFVDAFGSLSIPGGTYDVLREKRTTYTDVRVDIHVPFLGWQDITDAVGAEGLGRDTTLSYHFFNNVEKEPIAVVTMDSTGTVAQEVEYKDNGIPNAVGDISYANANVVLAPNPANESVLVDLKNFPQGQYTLRLYDATGHLVGAQQLNSLLETVSLLDVTNGTYFYQLWNANNKLVASGKGLKVAH